VCCAFLFQTCVTKHLLANDGHHEYIMTCDSNTVRIMYFFIYLATNSRTDQSMNDKDMEVNISLLHLFYSQNITDKY